MMFKLAQAAQKRWRRLNGHEQMVLFSKEGLFLTECCSTPPDPEFSEHNI